MSAEEFYFKVKPKENARVKAIASINLPFFKSSANGEYNAGVSIPSNGLPRPIEKNGIPFSEGTTSGIEDQYVSAQAQNALNDKVGFRTPEEQFCYRYGQPFNGSAPVSAQMQDDDHEVCFQTMYCTWDRNKFANFVIEALVGKALTHAIAYNYFGYPVSNASRRINLNYDENQDVGWGFGRMPDFGGSASPMDLVPEDNLKMGAGSIGGLLAIKGSNGSVGSTLAGKDPFEIGNGTNSDLYGEKTNDDIYSRYFHMLGASRKSKTVFVKNDEFNKFYTNSHVFEIRDYPATPASLQNAQNFLNVGIDASGYPEVDFSLGEYEDYESGRCPDSNYLFYKNQEEKGNLGEQSLGVVETVQQALDYQVDVADSKFQNPFQPITPTHARLWYPSFQTSMTTSPLGMTMGSTKGLKTSEWYYDSVPLTSNGTIKEGTDGDGAIAAQDLIDADFKTSNLVSMYKIVPVGIANEDKQTFLNKPHYTLNHILPKVLEYVSKVVPQNPKFAGPKPASREPDSKTTKSFLSHIESATIKPQVGSVDPDSQSDSPGEGFFEGCSSLQVHRVMSGSFFEFQVGRKWQNAPILARDARPEKLIGGEMVINANYEKLGAQEKAKISEPIYAGNHVPHKQLATKAPPTENIDYATKFGLWNNDWIGGNSLKLWQKSGQHQSYEEIYGDASPVDYYKTMPGGFMLMPRNAKTIQSMITSLPSQGSLGRATIAEASNNLVNSFEMTKLLSDLWLSYHFATKPNGMGFEVSGFYSDAIRTSVPEWKLFSNLEFKFNTKYQDKIKTLYADETTAPMENAPDLTVYNDSYPLLFANSPNEYDNMLYAYAGTPRLKTNFWNANYYQKFDYEQFNTYKGIDVPLKVNRVSQLEFPVWSWKRGGGKGYSDLNSINWVPLVQDPAGPDAATYAGSAFNSWKKYIEQNPNLIDQKRECVPKWVNSLKIYPTVKQDCLKYGFVPPNLPLSEEEINFYSDWDLGGWGQGVGIKEFGGSAQFQDFFWKLHDNSMDIYQKQQTYLAQFLGTTQGDLYTLKSYKNSSYLPYACHPWMTLNYEIDNNIYSENYKSATDQLSVTLSYAVELEIDENEIVLDLVRQGVVALAGEISDYVELGIDLDTLFSYANDASSFYSESLLNGFEAYNKSVNSQKYEGAGVDFGAFPSLTGGQDASAEALKQAMEALPTINKKIQEAKNEYPSVKYPITSYVWLKDLSKKTPIYSKPSAASTIIGYVENFTTLRVLKEWVKGKGEFNRVQIIDKDSEFNEFEGFMSPELLEPAIDDIFFSTGIPDTGKGLFDKGNLILSLQPTEVVPMADIAKASIPTWWKLEQPYYHREDGEYWVNVELKGEDCIVDDSDLEAKKELAVKVGLKQLFEFYNKDFSDEQADKFSKAYLATKIQDGDYILSMRPGTPIRFLLKVGGIYLHAVPNKNRDLSKLKAQSPYKIKLNQKFYQNHLVQALYGLNRLYLELFASEYSIENINFIKEIERLELVPIIIKQTMAANGINLNTKEENVIELGFDYNFSWNYISFKSKAGRTENLLDIGFDHFKKQNPMNNPNTMSLFFYHRELRNPMLKWRNAVEKYFINPKAVITKSEGLSAKSVPNTTCGPLSYGLPDWRDILGPIAANLDQQLQLDPRFDLGSFQFSLWKYFPPCPKPPSGIGDTILYGEYEVNAERFFFKDRDALNALNAVNWGNTKDYVGDWATSWGALEDIKYKFWEFDDLMTYLRGTFGADASEVITFFYSKICKCFLDLAGIDTITLPNMEIDADAGSFGANISPSDALPQSWQNKSGIGNNAGKPKKTKEQFFEGTEKPSVNATNPFTDKGKDFKAEDLFCSFCIEIPSFFLRLPTTNILDILIQALLKLLEALLAQLILELIKTLIEILLTCPELSCPPNERNLKDYGGADLGSLFNNNALAGLGKTVPQYFSACGLLIDELEVTSDDVIDLMTNISNRLTSGEALFLITDGVPTQSEIFKVAVEEIKKFPSIHLQLDNEGKIEDFFRCAGLGLPKNVIADLEDEMLNKFRDPEVCSDFLSVAKQQLADRCGISDLLDSSVDKALNHDTDKYKKLADAIRKNQDLSQSIPSLFGDCFGNQGVLSGLPNPAMDQAIEQTVESIAAPIRNALRQDLENLTKPIYNFASDSSNPVAVQPSLIKYSPKIEDMKRSNPFANTIELLMLPGGLAPGDDPLFKDIPFGSNISINKRLQLVEDVDDTENIATVLSTITEDVKIVEADNSITPPVMAGIEVKLPGDSGENIKLNIKPTDTDDDGNPIYTDNYSMEMTVKGIFDADKTKAETIYLQSKDNNLPTGVVDVLQSYNLDPTSNSIPQAQFFSELILDNFKKAGLELDSEKREKLKNTIEKEIYWNLWESALEQIATSLENTELLQNYQLNRQDEFIGFNPMAVFPILPLMLSSPILGSGVVDSVMDGFYGGLFIENELRNLDMKPYGDTDSIVNIQEMKEVIKKNYDFSKYSDPNSDSLGMPHYAILSGLIKGMIQVFVGEIYCRGIIPLSKLPMELITTEEYTVELIFRNMTAYLNSGDPKFQTTFIQVVQGLFSPCNGQSIMFKPDNEDDPEPGLPGTATGPEKDYRIEDWKDGLKFLIRLELTSPAAYIKNKLSSFRNRAGNSIVVSNPLSAITYSKILQVHDESFNKEKDNVSFFREDLIDQFKNGKIFMEFYFEIVDWSPGDENYNPALAERDSRLKGIMSEDNFVELISKLCGIPPNYPDNFAPDNPILTKTSDGTVDGDPLNIPFKDLFKEINFGIRFCYGAIQTSRTTEESETLFPEPILKGQRPKIADFVNEIKAIVGFEDQTPLFIDEKSGLPNDVTPDSENFNIIDFCQKTKSLVLCEEQTIVEPHEFIPDAAVIASDPLYTVILPLFEQKVKISGANAFQGGWNLLNNNTVDLNYISDQISLFILNNGSGYGASVINKIVSDLGTNPLYEALFRYALPLPKMASVKTIHGIAVASKDKNVEKAFDRTKLTFKDLILKTTQFVGKEKYKKPLL